MADRAGDLGVAARPAGRDRAQLVPDRALERRPERRERCREAQRAAAEIGAELGLELRDRRGPARHDAGPGARPQPLDLVLQPAPVDIFEQIEGLVVRDRRHRAERRVEPRGEQRARRPAGGWRAHDAGEGVAEAAAGLVAGLELRHDDPAHRPG
jgi:hypothetical protein